MSKKLDQIMNLQDIMDPIQSRFGKYFELACDSSINKITATNNKDLFCRFDLIYKDDEKICISYKLLDYLNYDILDESCKLFDRSANNLLELLYDFIAVSLQEIIA